MNAQDQQKLNRPPVPHDLLRTKLPFPAAELLPHGEPFALIDMIVEEWDFGGKTTSVVHPDHPLAAADGSVGIETYIEYGAQTAAVLDAFQRQDKSFDGLPTKCYLASHCQMRAQLTLSKCRGHGCSHSDAC